MSARAYADSSFLVSLYRADASHEAARDEMAQATDPLPFTPLHRIELRNALRNAHSFGQISDKELRLALRQIEDDLREGLLVHVSINWTDVCHRGDKLSEKYAAKEGQRTIDLLHVALAIESGAKTFLSFDNRQRKLAKAIGLTVRP